MMGNRQEKHHSHVTTRRGFVAAAGFGVVSLYLLWAGYGAAPVGVGLRAELAEPSGGEHGRAHGEAAGGISREVFNRLAQAFVEENKLQDGSVRPGRRAAHHPAIGGADHAMHGGAPTTEPARRGTSETGEEPIDVYLTAHQFGYTPDVLRLEVGVPYRFRMMAVDVAHGASLQLGPGARIVRLRPGALVEQQVTFTHPGQYLLYCTVYCGLGHDTMQGRIVVTEPGGKS